MVNMSKTLIVTRRGVPRAPRPRTTQSVTNGAPPREAARGLPRYLRAP